jgi:hypothetical protein
MKIISRIEALAKWGSAIEALLDDMATSPNNDQNALAIAVRKAYLQNNWFTPEYSIKALNEICSMLNKILLEVWVNNYHDDLSDNPEVKKVGIIMAGNIPAVGFHDLLCVLISGHKAVIRNSSDDAVLIPFLVEVLLNIAPDFANQIEFTQRISDIDAVIATGSNNSARYFDYYFAKYPSIIRRNRNSVAVLSGQETADDFRALGNDIFDYFGLGCRNVAKLYVPRGYVFDPFFALIEERASLMEHNKYMNNYDYHRALFLLDGIPFLTNNFLILRENEPLATPVSVVHYEFYDEINTLEEQLKSKSDEIQCRVGLNGLPFGSSQQPGLMDYADGVDVLQWLTGLGF